MYKDTVSDKPNHWWGLATLPEEISYPYNGEANPMTLVCQFAYGEGLVYIFADLDYFFGDMEADGGHIGEWNSNLYQVLYTDHLSDLHEHEIRYADGSSAVPEPRDTTNYESRILSKPTCWQDELTQDYPGYEVLVQLEEDDDIGLRFYDCGTLFFLIKPADLAARNFNNVKCVLYSY
ncbi:MAG: DUF1963 domain-containing protein [Paludibacteraceae bacterium]|nr:DUF1963 domain-containing protein [Paludibacteraceae bacterium]